MSQNERDKEKSCCTWPKIIVLVIVVVVGGVLIWRFAPIDEAINSVLPTFNNTGSGSGGGVGSSTSPPAANPTMAPADKPLYEFNRCADSDTECCLGLPNICGLKVNDVLFATAHNAMATFEDGFLFGPNHRFKLEDALEAGYRGINLDVCNCGGIYKFCHGVCGLGPRDVIEVLGAIDQFLDNNPNEVIFLPLELNSDADRPIDLDEFYSGYVQAVPGFVKKTYVHSNVTDAWPTLREMIDADKRIMIFHKRGPQCREPNSCPPGMEYTNTYVSDTEWRFETKSELEATDTSCPVSTRRTFLTVNSFVTPPKQDVARQLNSLEFARSRIEACSSLNGGQLVNFLIADFWSEGDLPRLVQEENSARATQRKLRQVRGA